MDQKVEKSQAKDVGELPKPQGQQAIGFTEKHGVGIRNPRPKIEDESDQEKSG
jgi:hypothetical protein